MQKAPPYVTYRIHGVVHASGDTNIERTVSVRTSDGDAVVHDEKTGQDVLRPPFPAPPNFDALSKFSLTGTFTISVGGKGGTQRDVDMRVVNVEPLYYTNPVTQADVDTCTSSRRRGSAASRRGCATSGTIPRRWSRRASCTAGTTTSSSTRRTRRPAASGCSRRSTCR